MKKIQNEIGGHIYILIAIGTIIILALLVWCGMQGVKDETTTTTSNKGIKIENNGQDDIYFAINTEDTITKVAKLPMAGLASGSAMWTDDGEKLSFTSQTTKGEDLAKCEIYHNANDKVNKVVLNMPYNMAIDEGISLFCIFTNHSSDTVHQRLLQQIAVADEDFVMQQVVMNYKKDKKDDRVTVTVYPVTEQQATDLPTKYQRLQYEEVK